MTAGAVAGWAPPAPIPRSVSDRIAIARVLCIFFMTFVHVQAGIAENVYDRQAGPFDLAYFVLTRLVGLSSVALLGIVSGYLIVASLHRSRPAAVMVSKVRTLLVPLVAWNVLMLVLLIGYGRLSGNWQDMPENTPLGIANAFLALTEWPLVVPLWFLRDLFVCCLLSPLLLAGLRRAPAAVFVALIAFTLFGEELFVMQRPQLLLLFAFGMWLRVVAADARTIDRLTRPLLIALVAVVAIFIWMRIERIMPGDIDQTLRIVLETALRITMAAGVWQVTRVALGTSFGRALARFEPYAFFLFCSHAVLFHFGGILLRRVFGNYGSDLFSISFFLQPFLAVAAAWIALRIVGTNRPLMVLFNAGKTIGGGEKRRAGGTRERRHA